MKTISHLIVLFGALIASFHTKENDSTPEPEKNVTIKHNETKTEIQKNLTTSAKFDDLVLPVGGKCKNDGNCKPGLKCCDAMGGNKCWECCEDVHCEGLGKQCWYVLF